MIKSLCFIFALFISLSSAQANPLLLKGAVGTGVKNAKNIKSLAAQARKKIYSRVPQKSGIYSFRDGAGKWYIGKSKNLRTRLQKHLRNGKFPTKNGHSLKIRLMDEKLLHSFEKNLIRLGDFKSKGKIGNIVHAPISRIQSKVGKVKNKVGAALSSLKSKIK